MYYTYLSTSLTLYQMRMMMYVVVFLHFGHKVKDEFLFKQIIIAKLKGRKGNTQAAGTRIPDLSKIKTHSQCHILCQQ